MRKRQYRKTVKKNDRPKILLRNLNAGTKEREIVISDEKCLTIEHSVNYQNNKVYTQFSAVID